jgi:cold shock CspA family protein
MRVTMYNPTRLYGFAKAGQGGAEVFFHLESFQPGVGQDAPPPILGEEVLVECAPNAPRHDDKPPRAQRVTRTVEPTLLTGTVESFNDQKQWGFVMGSDNVSYHLHRSEVLAGRLPIEGARVSFYGGARKGRPRACYVKVLD